VGGTFSFIYYIFDVGKNDWVLFMEHELVATIAKKLKPKVPPLPAKAKPTAIEVTNKEKIEAAPEKKSYRNLPQNLEALQNKEWFALKGENKFGPYGYLDIVKMLQEGVLYEFDFVWYEGLEGWTRIADMPAFSNDNIKILRDTSMPEIAQVFFRRRHRRVKYGGTILVHDNKSVWKGQALEISEGGVGVVMDNALVVPGQELYLHFKPGDGVPPFNAVCEVVSKQYVLGIKNAKAPIKYGLKFKELNKESQEAIKNFSKDKVA
jgi:hypothetical protein